MFWACLRDLIDGTVGLGLVLYSEGLASHFISSRSMSGRWRRILMTILTFLQMTTILMECAAWSGQKINCQSPAQGNTGWGDQGGGKWCDYDKEICSGTLTTRLCVRRRDSLSPMRDTVAPALTFRSELCSGNWERELTKISDRLTNQRFQ